MSQDGLWLNDPMVLLRAGAATSALLQLASPVYNASAKTITFQVCLCVLTDLCLLRWC